MTTPDSPLNPDTPCILPFKIGGIIHEECQLDLTMGQYWCPTKLGDDREFKIGEGNYGFCSATCPPLQEVDTNSIRLKNENATASQKKGKSIK